MNQAGTREPSSFMHYTIYRRDLADLAMRIRGELIGQDAKGYDLARRVFNAAVDRRPLAIVMCDSIDDITQSIRFAIDHDLRIAVRGGGHNIAGSSVCDDGIVLDLSQLKNIQVDHRKRQAIVGVGCTWGDADLEFSRFGLATTGGMVSTTGVAGLTLGGGIGWLMGQHGLACDNVTSAELVLADGTIVTCSNDENSELFWGIRGGGGNFGVITAFTFQLHPVSFVTAGSLAWALKDTSKLLVLLDALSDNMPDALTINPVFAVEEGLEPVFSLDFCYCGQPSGEETFLHELRKASPPVLWESISTQPYWKWQRNSDGMFPRGRRSYWRSVYFDTLSSDVADIIRECFCQSPSPLNVISIDHLHGAVSRRNEWSTAFSHRNQRFCLLIMANWLHEQNDEENITWVKNTFDRLYSLSTRVVYVNYLGVESHERVVSAYGKAKYLRLQSLKDRYDPSNVFRVNQNILPSRFEG